MQNKRKYGIIIKLLKRPHGQAVKTPPSHGGNWGSIPHGATKKKGQVFYLSFLFGIFLRELSRRAPRGCSRERSDALPRGPLRGFGRFPPRPSLPHGQVFYLSFLFGIFLRELSRRAPRGCSRERSDALPRGPLRGFGRFPPRPSPSRTGFLPVLSFWYFLRELHRRAPRGCSRERSDALPRGPLRGFGSFFALTNCINIPINFYR